MMWTALLVKYQYEDYYQSSDIAEQHAKDMMAPDNFDETFDLASKIHHRYGSRKGQARILLFEDADAVQALLDSDARKLKAHDPCNNTIMLHYHNEEIALPNEYEDVMFIDDSVDIQDEDKICMCNWITDEGNNCIF